MKKSRKRKLALAYLYVRWRKRRLTQRVSPAPEESGLMIQSGPALLTQAGQTIKFQ